MRTNTGIHYCLLINLYLSDAIKILFISNKSLSTNIMYQSQKNKDMFKQYVLPQTKGMF